MAGARGHLCHTASGLCLRLHQAPATWANHWEICGGPWGRNPQELIRSSPGIAITWRLFESCLGVYIPKTFIRWVNFNSVIFGDKGELVQTSYVLFRKVARTRVTVDVRSSGQDFDFYGFSIGDFPLIQDGEALDLPTATASHDQWRVTDLVQEREVSPRLRGPFWMASPGQTHRKLNLTWGRFCLNEVHKTG